MIRQDMIRQDMRTGHNKTGHDKTGHVKTGYDKIGHDMNERTSLSFFLSSFSLVFNDVSHLQLNAEFSVV